MVSVNLCREICNRTRAGNLQHQVAAVARYMDPVQEADTLISVRRYSQSQFIYRPPLPPKPVSKNLPNLWRIPPE